MGLVTYVSSEFGIEETGRDASRPRRGTQPRDRTPGAAAPTGRDDQSPRRGPGDGAQGGRSEANQALEAGSTSTTTTSSSTDSATTGPNADGRAPDVVATEKIRSVGEALTAAAGGAAAWRSRPESARDGAESGPRRRRSSATWASRTGAAGQSRQQRGQECKVSPWSSWRRVGQQRSRPDRRST